MKKAFILIALLLLTTQALALDEGSFYIKVTVNHPPQLRAFGPADGTTITEGDELTISVSAEDPNRDILEYRFIVNGTEKQAWSTEQTCIYTLTSNDIGLNTIKAEVRDDMETISTPEVEIFAFRGSPDLPALPDEG